MSVAAALSGAAWFYIWLMRGTPVLLQLVFLFDALPAVGIVMPAVTTAIVGFSLNEAAFSAEIVMFMISPVHRGEVLPSEKVPESVYFCSEYFE